MTTEEQLDLLVLRVEELEGTIIQLLETLIQYKDDPDTFAEYVGGDAQELKKYFEKTLKP